LARRPITAGQQAFDSVFSHKTKQNQTSTSVVLALTNSDTHNKQSNQRQIDTSANKVTASSIPAHSLSILIIIVATNQQNNDAS
jgi:hypothetical protein